ncbi:MAG: hypothetical protein QM754_01810 [Tepidisphaeraceae bacterium]
MFERRLQILLAVLAVFCVALVVRAVSLQAVGHSYWANESEKGADRRGRTPDHPRPPA